MKKKVCSTGNKTIYSVLLLECLVISKQFKVVSSSVKSNDPLPFHNKPTMVEMTRTKQYATLIAQPQRRHRNL